MLRRIVNRRRAVFQKIKETIGRAIFFTSKAPCLFRCSGMRNRAVDTKFLKENDLPIETCFWNSIENEGVPCFVFFFYLVFQTDSDQISIN